VKDLFFDVFRCFGGRNLIQFNEVILEKWLCRYAIEREVFWKSMVDYIRRGWGVFFLDLLDMRWEMGLRLGFGIICGVGTSP
jgi:hypothetical protein